MGQSTPHHDKGHVDAHVAATTAELPDPDDPGTRAADLTADLYATFEHERRKESYRRAVVKGRDSH
jgi:hypothetical protein